MPTPLDLQVTATFDYRFHATPDGSPAWLADRTRLEAVADVIAAMPLFAGIAFGGRDAMRPCRGDAATARRVLAVGREAVAEFQEVEAGRPDLLVRLAALEGSLEVKIWAAGAPLVEHEASLIAQCLDAAIGVRRALGGVGGLFSGHIAPTNRAGPFDYLQDRPPHRHAVFPVSSVADLIDLRFHGSGHPAALPEAARALAEAPPPGVARSEHDGLVVTRWTTLASAEALADAASAHDAWIRRRIATERAPRWNALGDRQEVKGTTQVRPPLTLYAPTSRIGYKAVMVSPEGRIEPEAWAEARAVLEAGALADGAPVIAVKLVAPLREHALAIVDEARAAGFAAVLYPADGGTLWDPAPQGRWRATPAAPA